MSPLVSWCLLGALITLFFAVLWLLSGTEEESSFEAEDPSWLEDEE